MVKGKPFDPLGRQLVFAAKAMRETFEDLLESEGATLGTWMVLNSLSDLGCVGQGVLANHVHLEGATITHHVDRLEAADLVRRVPDPTDRRVRKLELTEAGKALQERLLVSVTALERRVMSGLGAEELRVLAESLGRIQSNLTELKDEASAVGPADPS